MVTSSITTYGLNGSCHLMTTFLLFGILKWAHAEKVDIMIPEGRTKTVFPVPSLGKQEASSTWTASQTPPPFALLGHVIKAHLCLAPKPSNNTLNTALSCHSRRLTLHTLRRPLVLKDCLHFLTFHYTQPPGISVLCKET